MALKKWQGKLLNLGIGFVFIAVGIALALSWQKADSSSFSSKETTITSLKASVGFTGTQFAITNNDSFDWMNVRLEINPGLFGGGYSLEHPVILTAQTYTIGALQFAKSDGSRFNPVTMKAQEFAIYSRDRQNMMKGSYHSHWK